MTTEQTYTEEEKENMLSMLIDTVHALVQEKQESPKWKEKLRKIHFKINLEIPDAGIIHLILENGKYSVGRGKIPDPIIEIEASLERFFNFSSRQLSTFSAVFLGKLKIKGKRHLRTLLDVGNVLRIIPESKL
ncbi:MAG: SCP2 sterol-binding domain-containing protein [Candidatus Helarchaeota archaeon]